MLVLKLLRGPLGLVAFGVFFVLITVIGFLHFNPMCSEEMGMEKTSPDGRYVAASMIRNCGATTREVSHINLRPVKSKFGADFFSGTITGGEIFASSKYSGNRFCWSKPHKLSIGYPDVPMRNWQDVTIDDDFRKATCE